MGILTQSDNLDKPPPPEHVAIIMDGNGRWARARGMPRLKGHEAGAESVRKVSRAAWDAGVRYLTLYAFSIENWRRPREEIAGLMRLLTWFLRKHENELHAREARLRILGRLEDLPPNVSKALRKVEEATAGYTKHQLIIALSYGGRTEIAAAARGIAERVKAGALQPHEVDEAAVAAALYLPDVPDPDLIIRTSGEMRLSNFLLWQSAYSEFYATEVCWPDFGPDEFAQALQAFAGRGRRFGGITNVASESEAAGKSSC